MAALTLVEINTAKVKLARFQQEAQAYFDAVEGKVFSGFAYTENQAEIKARADEARAKFSAAMRDLDMVIVSGSYVGQVASRDDILEVSNKVKTQLENYHAAVQDWNKSNPSAYITGTVAKMFKTAFDTFVDIQQGINATVSTIAKWLPWVPWIVVGAFTLPTILRIIAKQKEEGGTAALRYSADAIDSGRAATGRAATKGAMTAAKLAMYV